MSVRLLKISTRVDGVYRSPFMHAWRGRSVYANSPSNISPTLQMSYTKFWNPQTFFLNHLLCPPKYIIVRGEGGCNPNIFIILEIIKHFRTLGQPPLG